LKFRGEVMKASQLKAAAIAVAATFTVCQAHSAAFQLLEHDAVGTGTANANTAEAGSIASMFANPAAMSFQSGTQFSGVMTPIAFSARFKIDSATSAVGTPATGGNGGDAGGTSVVPALFFATDLGANLRFGIGITAPYALRTEYDDGWVGRYFALRTDLETIDINPSLSFKVNDAIAIGVGVSAQRANAEISRAIDFGSRCIPGLTPLLGAAGAASACAQGLVTPQTRDGKVSLKANDWQTGFNVGAMFTLSPQTRIGVSYRSAITHKLSGQANFTNPDLPGALAALTKTPATTNGSANAELKLPDVFSIGVHHQLDQQWALVADVSQTRWNRFNEIRVKFDNGAADSVEPQNYRNTTRVAVGTTFQARADTVLRGGIAFDPTPVRDEYRVRVPDGDRVWLSLGASIKPSKSMSVDVGVSRLFVREPTAAVSAPGVGTLQGRYEKTSATAVAFQLNQSF
jgi:long-chain fatty acid transport protein